MQNRRWLATERIQGGSQLGEEKKKKERERESRNGKKENRLVKNKEEASRQRST